MLELKVSEMSMFNEKTQTFHTREARTLKLEHSLLSISKWESVYAKPFMTETAKTEEEIRYYIFCMDTTGKLTEDYVEQLSLDEIEKIKDYMVKEHTATTINGKKEKSGKKEIITSELIYYWLIAMGIPFEAETWNIGRLMMLIRICGIKNNPKKMSKRDTMLSNTNLNAMRRKAMGSMG